MRASGQTGLFWSPDSVGCCRYTMRKIWLTSYQAENVVVDSSNLEPQCFVEVFIHQSRNQLPGWRISKKRKLNIVQPMSVSVQPHLHLSETNLRVVTAAVSPLRLFLYIFSPCWFLLNFALMMLSMEHSTAWSDLDSVLFIAVGRLEWADWWYLPRPADITADSHTTLGALSAGSWLDQLQTVHTLPSSSPSSCWGHSTGPPHCRLGGEDGLPCHDVPGGHQTPPGPRDLRHHEGFVLLLTHDATDWLSPGHITWTGLGQRPDRGN